ncbi:oxygenase MpaB family protein [Streptacidiphilus monticola]|uniref:Oxygenase MpaB family protein n=1 Tax=Streptacidiphilus monticola TaxID=2161674 RepID=A0ABW1G7A3_9ACTN
MPRTTARDTWLRRIQELDPERDFEEIYRISCAYEFPWDTTQALGMALYRTYAVPAIGGLLARTGELTRRPQKRYDDTVLLLDASLEHGLDSPAGRQAQRRVNQMHRHYDIPDDQFRYVLATFVVIPKRWLDDFGWRPYSPAEIRASVNYYRALGQRMNIKDIPSTYEEFEELLDSYEREHFAFDAGGRAVSDATLALVASWFRPFGGLMRRATICLMDDPLRESFRYPAPSALLRRLVLGGMRARGRLVRLLPPRRKPFHGRQSRRVRGYPGYPAGYRLSDLGTFPTTAHPGTSATAPDPSPPRQ